MTDAPQEEEVLDSESIYDHERLQIAKVLNRIQNNVGRHRELSGFQREVRERFAEIGFVARVDFVESPYEEHMSGPQEPSITLVRRCEPTGEFDHEKMGHEVRSNLLGINAQGNTQKTQISPGFKAKSSGLIVPD